MWSNIKTYRDTIKTTTTITNGYKMNK